jgi:hypothetical protein
VKQFVSRISYVYNWEKQEEERKKGRDPSGKFRKRLDSNR